MEAISHARKLGKYRTASFLLMITVPSLPLTIANKDKGFTAIHKVGRQRNQTLRAPRLSAPTPKSDLLVRIMQWRPCGAHLPNASPMDVPGDTAGPFNALALPRKSIDTISKRKPNGWSFDFVRNHSLSSYLLPARLAVIDRGSLCICAYLQRIRP